MLRDLFRPVAHTARMVVGTVGLNDRLTTLERSIAAGLEASPAPPAAAPPEPPPARPAIDVNFVLHESRGALLRGMPPGAKRMLSAGCAGTWYFKWIEETYGRVPEHLGIEFYQPMPDDLPSNVKWIANTASDMSAVESESCDLVFSGQNLEHLWPEEVAGFALEAARVLRLGGSLVVDSPNRLLTTPLNWSHPQHTIELTPEEARRLLHLAGFDVTATYGIWLCRDARNGAILPFDPNQPCPGWSLTERILFARENPDDAFIWWVEAVRTDREPEADAVHALMNDLFRKHWPERVQRLLVPPGHGVQPSPEGEWVVCTPGQAGAALFGPYMPLKAGHYRVTWRLRTAPGAAPVAICDVLAEGYPEPLASREVLAGESEVTLEFSLSSMTFGLQYRCLCAGGAGFSVLRRIMLEENVPVTAAICAASPVSSFAAEPLRGRVNPRRANRPSSRMCRYSEFLEDWYIEWAGTLGLEPAPRDDIEKRNVHRKAWEWCAIAETLQQRGMLQSGRTGVGFAVGTEPLTSAFAARGVSVLSTDLGGDEADWNATKQHAASREALFHEQLVSREIFEKKVGFQHADMRDLSGLGAQSFDFAWSSCAFEHLGSLPAGLRFVREAMRFVKPGGLAVHTTEFNVSSNHDTLTSGPNVIYRRQDIEALGDALRGIGCALEPVDFDPGHDRHDLEFDYPPYFQNGRRHVKLLLGPFVSTSILLVIDKGTPPPPEIGRGIYDAIER